MHMIVSVAALKVVQYVDGQPRMCCLHTCSIRYLLEQAQKLVFWRPSKCPRYLVLLALSVAMGHWCCRIVELAGHAWQSMMKASSVVIGSQGAYQIGRMSCAS